MTAMRSPQEIARHRFYRTAAWRKFRDAYLREHPLCVECGKRGYFIPAVHLDHIEPLARAPDLALAESNVAGLCLRCHSSKTRGEQTGGTFKHWSDKRVGVDGLPLSPSHKWNREVGDD